jgi:hypothetical protein
VTEKTHAHETVVSSHFISFYIYFSFFCSLFPNTGYEWDSDYKAVTEEVHAHETVANLAEGDDSTAALKGTKLFLFHALLKGGEVELQ